jgi:hypothetical protein
MNERCYVCRKPVPNGRGKAKAKRWCNITIATIPIGALCRDCFSRRRGQSASANPSLRQ